MGEVCKEDMCPNLETPIENANYNPSTVANAHSEASTIPSQEDIRDIRVLLIKYKKEAFLMSEIHMLSARYCRNNNQYCTIVALLLSILCSIANPIIIEYSSKQIHELFSSITFAFIGGLNVVFNFIAYQKRMEQHKQVQVYYIQIIDIVEHALAVSSGVKYDFNKVLSDVRSIRNTIAKNGPPVPNHIAKRYESILVSSLVKHELHHR